MRDLDLCGLIQFFCQQNNVLTEKSTSFGTGIIGFEFLTQFVHYEIYRFFQFLDVFATNNSKN